MPHYKNGREAKVGDRVVVKDRWSGRIYAGIVSDIVPGAAACNATIVPTVFVQSITLGDAMLQDEAELAEVKKEEPELNGVSK